MKKAIIIQNKYIGDVLVASILAKNLKKIFPAIEVHFFCYKNALGILENNPYIDKTISFDDKELKKISVLRKYGQLIQKEKYDILIDPYGKIQSRIITLFSKATYKISYDRPIFKWLYTHTFEEEKQPQFVCCTSIENRGMLLKPFVKNLSELDYQTEIFLTEQEISDTKEMMKKSGISFSKPILVLGVLGSSLDKSLPLSYMAEIVNHILKNFEVDILFNYVPSQQNDVDLLLSFIPQKEKIFTNILGNNIREFATILKNSDALIANEGGAINISKALSKPTFSIFSPHKFRKDWGCYENLTIHKSFHLEDINPEIYSQYSVKEILKNPTPFYDLMESKFIIPQINDYMQNTLQIKPIHQPIISVEKPESNKITALCITYNEEKNILDLLQDISFADEIIVVDSFSTDSTIELASSFPKVKILQRKFDNFTNQKNFAIEHASHNWIIFFDADERISDNLKQEILSITASKNNTKDAYWAYRKFYLKGKYIKHSGWQNDKAIRLFKKNKSRYKKDLFVHEKLSFSGQCGFFNEKLDHYSFQAYASYKQKLDLYAKLKAEELYKKGIKANFIHTYVKPSFRFIHHYIFRLGILDGKNGYLIAKMYAQHVHDRYKNLKNLWSK